MTGEGLKNAVLQRGYDITYSDNMTPEMRDRYWDDMARKYASAFDFAEGIGLTEQDEVTVSFSGSGSFIAVDTEYTETGEREFTVIHKDGRQYSCKLTVTEVKEYGNAWNWENYSYVEDYGVHFEFQYQNPDDGYEGYTMTSTVSSHYIWFNNQAPDDDYFDGGYAYYFAVEPASETSEDYCIVLYSQCWKQYRFTKHPGVHPGGYVPNEYETYYEPSPEGTWNRFVLTALPISVEAYTITFTKTAGGGGGFENPITLVFTASAGLSGRHCDPVADPGWLYHPAPRTEVPAYGSGGYGGHGGGGGAGASTVVIYKFDSARADYVEQVARTLRHGYGSGGGQGGKGGDGCILIFW